MIRICHIQVLPLLTGVQRVMLDIFRRLDRDRFDLHVVCQNAGPLTEELQRRGIGYHLEPALGRSVHPLRDLRALFRLERWLRAEKFQLVHTHSSKPGILGRLAARRAGVPRIVHHVHGFGFHEFSPPWTRRLYAGLERWAGLHCDRVIFVNAEERELAIRQGILPPEKCLTIYNGIDLDGVHTAEPSAKRSEIRQQHGWSEQETVILMMGRLDRQKQPLLVPRIAAELGRLRPQAAWRIAIAGSGSLEADLRRQIHDAGLQGRMQLLGWQPVPQTLYCGADVVLHPTLWEGLPLSLLDAQGAGLPTVASDVKGNREVVSPDTGFLCQPQEAAGYADALTRLLDDVELRQRLGSAARRRAEQYFDAARNYQQVADLYDELLELPRCKSPLRPAA